MDRNICVFCASSGNIAPDYFESASELGKKIADNKDALVYGGGNIGLMGALALAVRNNGGKVIGVIPEIFNDMGLAYEDADEMIVTKDMRRRKEIMEMRSDAFITMPGGFGTLEELLEIITLKQIRFHQKPVVILNVNNSYKNLIVLFEQLFDKKFIKDKYKLLYYVAPDVDDALSYIETYAPHPLPDKV